MTWETLIKQLFEKHDTCRGIMKTTPLYKTKQKARILGCLSEYCDKDTGNGTFKKKKYSFALQAPEKNLWSAIRKDAIIYFHESGIGFWRGGPHL